MKKLVFAAIAMMVMVSASNSFATKSATSMKGYNTAVVDTTDTTKTNLHDLADFQIVTP